MEMRYQPQGLLRIARTPLAAGLRLAVLPGVNRVWDAASGGTVAPTGTRQQITASGMAAGFGATQGVAASDRLVTPLTGDFPSTTGRSYFFRARRNGGGGSGFGRLFDKTSGGNGQMLYWSNSNGRLVYSIYANNSERITNLDGTNVSAAIGELFDVLVTHRLDGSISTLNAWVNGTQVLFDSVPPGTIFNDTLAALCLGNRADGVRGWDGLIECAYVWDRVLSAADAAALRQNRYQIFDDLSDDGLVSAAVAQPNTYTLIAAPGTFELAGAGAGLSVTRRLAGGNGSFSLTGIAAGLRASRRVAGAVGVITLAGASATVAASRKLSAAPGAFALAGAEASLPVARRIAAAAGAFTLSGVDAQLTYLPVPEAHTIVAGTGQLVLSGAAVGMRVTRRMQAQAGSFALAGAAAAINYTAPTGEVIDISKISPARIVVFEGSGSRVVPFESSGSRVTPFGGSGSRVTPFEGSGSRTVRF